MKFNITPFSPAQSIFYLTWLLCVLLSLPIINGKVGFISLLLLIFWLHEGDFKNKFLVLSRNKFFISILLLMLLSVLSLLWSTYYVNGISKLSPYKYYIFIIPILLTSISRERVKSLIFAFTLGIVLHAILMLIFKNNFYVYQYRVHLYSPYAVYAPFFSFSAIYFLNKIIHCNHKKYSHNLLFYYFSFSLLAITLFTNPGRSGHLSLL